MITVDFYLATFFKLKCRITCVISNNKFPIHKHIVNNTLLVLHKVSFLTIA